MESRAGQPLRELALLTWCQKSNMDSFHKPSALSFDGNTSENWRRFKQQFDIHVTASGSEKKDDTVKIAILLNFAGEDAIEVFNTFQFAEGDEKKLNKVLEQFEQHCNPRKNVVFERHQFWQITQKDSETVDQLVTRLKNKVKSCEYPSGLPNDTKTGNLTYDSKSTANVFPRQLQLIINFPGKKISTLHC